MFNRAHGKGGTSVKAVDSIRGGDRGTSIPTAIPIAMTAITCAVLNNNSVKFDFTHSSCNIDAFFVPFSY